MYVTPRIKPRPRRHVYVATTGRVYVRLPNVCCSAFGYAGAPFSVACLLINPETLIASRAREREHGRGPRVFSMYIHILACIYATQRDTRSRERIAACLYVTLYMFNLAPGKRGTSSGVTARG